MFDLTKWYADAVPADGDFLDGYYARLRCGGFSVSYSSVLDSNGQRHCLRPSSIDVGETGIHRRTPARVRKAFAAARLGLHNPPGLMLPNRMPLER